MSDKGPWALGRGEPAPSRRDRSASNTDADAPLNTSRPPRTGHDGNSRIHADGIELWCVLPFLPRTRVIHEDDLTSMVSHRPILLKDPLSVLPRRLRSDPPRSTNESLQGYHLQAHSVPGSSLYASMDARVHVPMLQDRRRKSSRTWKPSSSTEQVDVPG